MSDIQAFNGYAPTWCPGCGDWTIGAAIKSSLVSQNLDPSSLAVVFGIGCSGNMNDFLNAYAMHSLHGRAIPTAVGIKLANHSLPVLVIAGDGDTYGEGGNHLLHACRGNHDMTIIIHDNGVYGLTTGQVAPTALHGAVSKSTPTGMIERPISPLTFLISQGATFVAQSFAGNLDHVSTMISQAMQHKGLSVVNILQPCVSFNHVNTYQYYLKKTYKLAPEYDPSNKEKALITALDMEQEKYPLGVLYKVDLPVYHEQVPHYNVSTPLVSKPKITNLDMILEEFE